MKHAAWLTLLVLFGACAETPAPELERSEHSIVNGTRNPTHIPLSEGEVLAIGFLHQAGFPSANFCTGTLISPRVVATASHCTEDQWASNVGFGVGLEPTSPRASVGVSEIHNHPWLDAAILILDQDMTRQVPELTPVAFNRQPLDASWRGRNVEAGGFGETRDASRTGRWFAVVNLESIGNDYITVNGQGQRGICFGDSGGPVFGTNSQGRPIQLAVESNGDSSCVGRDNMTRLDNIQDWIEQVAGQHLVEAPQDNNPPQDACGGIDYLGHCDGDVAEWCYDGQLERRDCAALGSECRYIDDTYGHICDCGDLGAGGRCNGDVAEYCVGGRLSRTDCRAEGRVCGASSGGGFGCTDTPNCGDVDALGYCLGESIVRCSGGKFEREDCGQYGGTCAQEPGAAAICNIPGGGGPDERPPSGGTDDGGGLVGGPQGGGAFVDNGEQGGYSWEDEEAATPPQAACSTTRTGNALRLLLRR